MPTPPEGAGPLLQLVEGHNLGTDAELHALRNEHDRLTAQLAAGQPPIWIVPPRAPRALALPGACQTCLTLQAQLKHAVAEAGQIQRKRAAMHKRYRRMLRKQDEYRIERDSLIRKLATARARMRKAGVPRNGPITRRVTPPPRRAQ